ncbi:MAG: 2-C-methyl-D-erythritol 4-phosphate cytidylyltransferase [Gammaproteobacteria bacterium]|nr:2-C-methyl-D-erythritol 4-phosphate cytidylyltransferase [Gammaproteobacteria bacterium]
MGAALPKQYLLLAGRPVIAHTLERLGAYPLAASIVVALAEDDRHWAEVRIECERPVWTVGGGAYRCHSVLSALRSLAEHAAPRDWVIVHDAARPCVRLADMDRLIEAVAGNDVGGLLAIPVHDTVKRGDADGRVQATVERAGLWHALTPQMFRFGLLFEALRAAVAEGVLVTDESAAVERAGAQPILVEGHADNIKITRPGDLRLAEFFLGEQRRGA